MDHRVDPAQGVGHVPRRGDVADDRAGRLRRHFGGAAQEDADAVARGGSSRRRWRPTKPVEPVRAISGALTGALRRQGAGAAARTSAG